MDEIREILDDFAEAMKKDRPTKGNSRHEKKKVSRNSATASASDAHAGHAVPVAQETAETALPNRPAITLTFRSRGPAEGDGAAVRNGSGFDKRISQDRLSPSASHDHDHGRADAAPIPADYIYSQDHALDDANDDDVVISDE
jgi:hypothetical protein